MRNDQLKFRCWDKVNKKFVPPSHIAINGNGILLITDSGMYEKLQNKNYCNVDREYVVQQFTGETDKNKNPIYEGDIIRSYSEEYINESFEAEIVFMDASFHAKVNEKDYRGVWSGDDIEVMGNIFQLPCNPDHNGECLVCDNWLCDCPFNKEKAQDDLQKPAKQDPMWQKPLSIADSKQ